MKVKFKRLHEDAVLPSYAKAGDAGLDLTAVTDGKLVQVQDAENAYQYVEYDTGIAAEIPEGHVGLLFPRSSVSKTAMSLANSVGVVDSGYRDSIKLRFKLDGLSFVSKCGATKLSEERMNSLSIYRKGERVGQLMILPVPFIEVVDSLILSESERGKGGFGSSGK